MRWYSVSERKEEQVNKYIIQEYCALVFRVRERYFKEFQNVYEYSAFVNLLKWMVQCHKDVYQN